MVIAIENRLKEIIIIINNWVLKLIWLIEILKPIDLEIMWTKWQIQRTKEWKAINNREKEINV